MRQIQKVVNANSPFEKKFADLVERAVEKGASDFYVEPLRQGLQVRARISGELSILDVIQESRYAERFIAQAKNFSGFDMGKIGVPQDARLSLPGTRVDIRSSLMPTLYGEKIVLRFLDSARRFSLDDLAVSEQACSDLRTVLQQWQGLIVVSGPTGSGKTTLLYSALAEIDKVKNSIHTLEDPIEYGIDGVTQTQVSREGQLTFADGLRGLMRQDPDVILIGEIRDKDTALAAVHAARTGHLVLSTVHADSAAGAISQLDFLAQCGGEGAREHVLFASTQRLVPKLCGHCKRQDQEAAAWVYRRLGATVPAFVAVGCSRCDFSGTAGTVLLFEYFSFQKIKSPPQDSAAASDPRSEETLRESAQAALLRGDISVEVASPFLHY